MRTLLIGESGQLGLSLQSRMKGDVVPLSHRELEITNLSQVRDVLSTAGADLVINAAAYNLVDQAEDEPQLAYAVNALGPRNLASVCGKLNVPLLHVSTDFVFGLDAGRATPYSEEDVPGPLGAYGVSKLAGEHFVRSLCPRHYVVRTCGLYGHSATTVKMNFVEKMLRLAGKPEPLSIVDDHLCTPTSSVDLAGAIADLVKTGKFGLYHATNSGSTTWHRFAVEIFRQGGLDVQVQPITSAEFKSRARRPLYSVLDNRRLSQAIGYELRPWQEAVAAYLEDTQG